MAISTYTLYEEKMRRLNAQPLNKQIANNNNSPLFIGSCWRTGSALGPVPTSPVVCDISTAGGINQESTIGGSGYNYVCAKTSLNASSAIPSPALADRLCHQAGLQGIPTTAQTTNLPTAALTRYTSGEGVMAALEFYTAIGTTVVGGTVSYTNQAGVSGRTSQPFVLGGTGRREVNSFVVIMPQNGDTGFRSVESLTLDASTGTNGNIGITLYRPLHYNHPVLAGTEQYGTNTFNNLIGGGLQFEVVQENACIMVWGRNNSGSSVVGTYQFMDIT